jgi:hypothetical protein
MSKLAYQYMLTALWVVNNRKMCPPGYHQSQVVSRGVLRLSALRNLQISNIFRVEIDR